VAAAPRRAGRSRRNYAHLLAERLGLELHDVTCSGAAAAGMRGATAEGPGQVEALTRDTALVTVTCGGNDVGYVGALTLASLPRPVLGLPAVRRRLDAMMSASDERFTALPETLDRLYAAIRERAPEATLVVVDYLTILPPPGRPARPVSPEVHGWGLEVAARLEEETAAAARRAGAVLVRAGRRARGTTPGRTSPGPATRSSTAERAASSTPPLPAWPPRRPSSPRRWRANPGECDDLR